MFRTTLSIFLVMSVSQPILAMSQSKLCTKKCTNKDIDLTSKEFKHTSFDNIIFDSVNFTDANLSDAKFEKTQFTNVKFTNSNMNFVEFKEAKIKSSVFEKVYAENYLTFDSSSIEGVVFRDLKIKNLDLSKSIISSCTFDRFISDSTKAVSLSGTTIISSDFKDEQFGARISLENALISNSNFANTRFMSFVNTNDLRIEKSRFSNAFFANTWHLVVHDSDFSDIRMEGESGGYLKCYSSNFSGATIKDKKFWISSSENCNFTNADLSSIKSVNFKAVKNSNFCNAKMPDGTIGKCEK